jgi:hypothetical protein
MASQNRQLIRTPSLRSRDLRWQCVEVSQEKSTKTIHLVCHFSSGFFVPVERFVSVQPKFISPGFQLGGYAVFSSHFVNSFLNFPFLDVRRESFQSQFHRFAIHAAGCIEIASSSGLSCLLESASNSFRDVFRNVNFYRTWEYIQDMKSSSGIPHQISGISRRVFSRSRANHYANGQMAGSAFSEDRPQRRIRFIDMRPYAFKRHSLHCAMRTIQN